jgi:hypothetical protein
MLNFPELKVTDAGIYKINAKNSIGEASYLVNLKIKSIPKILKALKNKIECVENSKLELSCILSPVYPQPEYQWFRNDEEILESESSNIVVLKDNYSTTLLIENVDILLDLSKFKLKATNELGSCETETSIEVFVIPKFSVPLNDIQPQLNNPFDWLFEIDSHPEPKLKLYKNDKEINLSRETRIKLNKEFEARNERKIYKYNFNFANILADDLGTYRIEATNKVGESKTQAQITVIGSPCFIKKPLDTSIVLNKPAKIECEIAGIPNPDFIWLKNGEPIINDDRVKIEIKNKTTYILNIKNCIKEDNALYTVKISNSIGTAEESFNLSIQGKRLYII